MITGLLAAVLMAASPLASMPYGQHNAAAQTAPASLDAVRARLTAECETGQFAGVVVATKDGREAFRLVCGLADVDSARPIADDTVFKAFSVSKAVTGTVLMRLIERGDIQLDAPASQYIEEMPAGWREVTIRQLLQHTSGLPDLTEALLTAHQAGAADHADAMHRVLTSSEVAASAAPAAAGTAWSYNNFGYELLALAAARTQHKPYHEVVRALIFEPVGMGTAQWELPPPWTDPMLAQGYVGTAEALRPTQSLVYVQQGAGALHVAHSDLTAFARALQADVLVSPAMMQQNLAEAFPVNENVKYGFGWMVRQAEGHAYLQHSGGNNGFVAELAFGVDKDVTVVVIANRGYVDASAIRRDLITALLAD